MKRLYWLLVICLFAQIVNAQQLSIEGINKENMTSERRQFVVNDNNDTPCALVVVNGSGIRISGNVIGKPLQNGKESIYNVASGTKKITITKKGSLPLNLNMGDFGIKYLESNFVYAIKVKETILSKEVSGIADGHEYVDLGLSVKWATMNLGANNATELGNLYVYNSKDPVTEGVPPTIHYDTPYRNDWWKNDEGHGYYGLRRLKKEEDIAKNTWGKRWRLPTDAECRELEELKQVETFRNGQKGTLFMASNGNTMFFPDWGDGGSIATATAGGSFRFDGYDVGSFWDDDMGDYVRPVLDEYPEAEDWQFMYSLKPDRYYNGYGCVDLGLSVLWATSNIGADDPTACGDSYAWGETRRKDSYTEVNYKFGVTTVTSPDGSNIYKRYSADNDIFYGTNGSRFLLTRDDVARATRGSTWQMPEWKHFEELKNKCEWKWTYNYRNTGIHGYFIISKVPGYTDKAIFLPADADDGESLPYWSNEVDMKKYKEEEYSTEYNKEKAYALGRAYIEGDDAMGITIENKTYRCYALYVRPIIKK